MSGVFMDGGGHDHMGHGIQLSHGDGGNNHGSFMDGGGNNHSTFLDGGSDVQGHHGGGHGEGGFLGNLLGFNEHSGHGFLSHLLGLDHDHGGHNHLSHDALANDGAPQPGQAPSQSAIWTSALQHVNIGHVFEGFKVTPNFWFGVMYVVFIGWLFLVYWLRRHEPFADAVLGKAPNAVNSVDRRLISGTSASIPIKTSQGGGSIYVPIRGAGTTYSASQVVPGTVVPSASPVMSAPQVVSQATMNPAGNPYGMPSPQAPSALQAMSLQSMSASPAIAAPVPPAPMTVPPANAYAYQPYAPMPSGSVANASAPVQVFGVPVQKESGSRVRMYVNR